MITRDAEMLWRPARKYIPVTQFTGLVPVVAVQSSLSGVLGTVYPDTDNFVFAKQSATARVSSSAVVLAPSTNFSTTAFNGRTIQAVSTNVPITGLRMNTATDDVVHFMELPDDFDIKYPMYVRVWYTGENTLASATNKGMFWRVRYTAVTPGTTAAASPTTALSTAITAHSPSATALAIAHTPAANQGKLNGETFSQANEAVIWRVERQLVDGWTDNVFLLGLELIYTPRRLHYQDGMKTEAKRPTNLHGTAFAD